MGYDLVVEKEQVKLLPGIWIAVGMVLAFNVLVYGSGGVLGFGTWLLLGVGGVSWMAREKHNYLALVLVGVGIILWLGVLTRNNEFVSMINFLGLVALIGFTTLIGSVKRMRWTMTGLLKTGLGFGLGLIPHFFGVLETVFAVKNQKYKNWGSVLKIVFISGVLVVVFGGLLIASDPVFASLAKSVVNDAWGRLSASLVVGGIVVWATSKRMETEQEEKEIVPWLTGTELAWAVVVLEVLFGIFLVVQAKYLFASHEVFKTFGITYSDYVRRGFFELIAAVTLGGIVSYVLGLKTKSLVGLALPAELGLILMSAWWRDRLYIDMHGLTRIRIVGEVGVWCLAGVLVLLALREAWRQFDETKFLLGLAAIMVAGMGYLNMTNIDMQIVAKPPIRFDQPDYFVLGNLSADAVAGWEQTVKAGASFALEANSLHTFDDKNVWKTANLRLGLWAVQRHRNYLQAKYGDEATIDMKRFNLSEFFAWGKILDDRSLYFDTLDESLRRLDVIARKVGYAETQKENWILNDFDYPLMDISR